MSIFYSRLAFYALTPWDLISNLTYIHLSIYLSIYLSMFNPLWKQLFPPVLSLIRSSIHISFSTSGWNEFKSVHYFFPSILFLGYWFLVEWTMIWKTQWPVVYLYMKNLQKSQWWGNLQKKRALPEVSGRIVGKSVENISSQRCYILSWSFF